VVVVLLVVLVCFLTFWKWTECFIYVFAPCFRFDVVLCLFVSRLLVRLFVYNVYIHSVFVYSYVCFSDCLYISLCSYNGYSLWVRTCSCAILYTNTTGPRTSTVGTPLSPTTINGRWKTSTNIFTCTTDTPLKIIEKSVATIKDKNS